MADDTFKHESLEDPESIVRYLQALQDGFANGTLLFSTDESNFVVKPTGLLNLEIDAKKKGEKVKLTLRLRWNEASAEPDVKPRSLTISHLENAG